MEFNEYRNCRLCPRNCQTDRVAGKTGKCGETATCRIASYGSHHGEEPPFSGTRGSGTIFFTGCSSRCFFCQNYQISLENSGYTVTPEELVDIGLSLVQQKVHNLNFVTPDHFWPHIEFMCREIRNRGVTLPFLFNASGYQRPDRIDEYAELMDIFMPDFKFADPDLAQTCMEDKRYPEIALASLRKMVELKGFLEPFDLSGRNPAQKGVFVRHLVLPGCVENSLRVLRLLKKEFGRMLPLSIMSQFHPMPECLKRGLFTETLQSDEYHQVCELAYELEFQNVFVQHMAGDDEFLPDFSLRDPFRGNRKKEDGNG